MSRRWPILVATMLSFAGAQAYAQQKMKLVQDGCPVTEEQVKKDAAELGPLLLQGLPEFYRRFTSWYGYQKARECALQGFMKELHIIDPGDVRLTIVPPVAYTGHVTQNFPAGSPDPTFKGYDLNTWRIVSQGVVEELSQHVKTSSVVTVEINNNVDPNDREVFIADFKKRKGKIPFDIRQNEAGELVVFSTESN
jgi:hypothetical protein